MPVAEIELAMACYPNFEYEIGLKLGKKLVIVLFTEFLPFSKARNRNKENNRLMFFIDFSEIRTFMTHSTIDVDSVFRKMCQKNG